MYSKEDIEKFYFQYQTEAVPSGESVQSFCKRTVNPTTRRNDDQYYCTGL